MSERKSALPGPEVGPPLGRLSAEAFLSEHWQKRPLLIRAALPGLSLPFGPDDLKRLATRPGVRSRLVALPDDRTAPSAAHPTVSAVTGSQGPFTGAELDALPAAGWALLVHEVDRHVDAFAGLLERFRFVPNWRIDDVMVSLAPDGGGVGPHVDRYDVFLLQGRGRRRWRIREAPPAGGEDSSPGGGAPTSAGWDFDREYELDPGDMLYLPPGVPHDGVALGQSMTVSIGFRAPDPRELCASFLTQLPPAAFEALRYADPGLTPAEDPGEIPAAARARLRESAAGLFARGGDFDRWVGCYVTRPLRESPPPATDVPHSVADLRGRLTSGAVLRRSAPPHFAWFAADDGVLLFVGGESYPLGADHEAQAALLCGREPLDLRTLAPWLDHGLFAGILIDLTIRGYLRLQES